MSENNQNIPPRNWCASRFFPRARTVEFEFGTMPYDHHGKPMSFLDVAENLRHLSRPRVRRRLRLHHLPPMDQGSGRHQRARMTTNSTASTWPPISS